MHPLGLAWKRISLATEENSVYDRYLAASMDAFGMVESSTSNFLLKK